MPCFNCENYIDDAISSVVNQDFKNWELIICDDGSKDNSSAKIKSWMIKDIRILSVVNKYQKGAAGARNSCLDFAKGRYIAFLDADDIWYPEKLEVQINLMKKNDIVFTFSDYICINEDSSFMSYVKAPKRVNFNKMLASNFIGCLTAVYDSKYFGKCYQPMIKKRNDYALWLEILGRNKSIYAYSFAKPLGKYRVNSYGLSSNKVDAMRFHWACIRRYAKSSFIKAIFFSFIYLLIIFIKKYSPNLYNKFIIYV